MTLAFVEDGVITKYPIGLVDVRRKYPQISFPRNFEEGDFAEYGVVKVHDVPQPSVDFDTERLEEGTPNFDGTQWNQVWNLVPLTAEEQQQITENKASRIRAERNQRLTNCDWTQLADNTADTNAWAAYRQALRDLPAQAGFPHEITWPTEPTT